MGGSPGVTVIEAMSEAALFFTVGPQRDRVKNEGERRQLPNTLSASAWRVILKHYQRKYAALFFSGQRKKHILETIRIGRLILTLT